MFPINFASRGQNDNAAIYSVVIVSCCCVHEEDAYIGRLLGVLGRGTLLDRKENLKIMKCILRFKVIVELV